LAARILSGQTVQGVALESDSTTPARRLIIALLDSTGNQVTRTLTSDLGKFLIRAPAPGRYRLKGMRIGYRSTLSREIVLDSGSVAFQFIVERAPVAFAPVQIRQKRVCKANPDSSAAAFRMWNNARNSLAAVVSARRDRMLVSRLQIRMGKREHPLKLIVVDSIFELDDASEDPFISAPSEHLDSMGYIAEHKFGATAYAPDEEVLLSELFATTHCFSLVADTSDENNVGLVFIPVPDRKVADIEGILWMDRRTSALRSLEFTYTRTPHWGKWSSAGGRVEFIQILDGISVISRWHIQLPGLGQDREELYVRGGTLLSVQLATRDTGQAPLLWKRELRAITGVVLDSLSGRPINRAVVRVRGTPFFAVTDSVGHFRLEYDSDGRYALIVHNALADSMGESLLAGHFELTPGVSLSLRASEKEDDLKRTCDGSWNSKRASVLLGTVYSLDDHRFARGAKVRLRWEETEETKGSTVFRKRTATVKTDDHGRFAYCKIPHGATVTVEARSGRARGAEEQIRLGNESHLFYRLIISTPQ
jgi:hypothetical protein